MADAERIIWSGNLSRYENGRSYPIAVRLTGRVLQIRNICSELNTSSNNSNHCNNNNNNNVVQFETFWLNEIVSCDRVTYEDIINDHSYHSNDGCCSRKSKNNSDTQNIHMPGDMCLRFIIYSTRTSDRRKAQRFILNILDSTTQSEQQQQPSSSSSTVDNVAHEISKQNTLGTLYCEIEPLISSDVHRQKPLLVFINPNSGKGLAIKLFDKRVRSILEDCKVKHQIFITKYPKHATDFVRDTPDIADKFSALCTISGDGLLWEVINGFVDSIEQQNSDSPVLPIPIGIIPGGSGNGLAHSLNSFYYRGGKSSDALVDNTLHVAKGRTVEMDLVRYTTQNRNVFYGFLSFGWGLMSDIDIESERLRFLGEARFSVWSLYRAANTKKYLGTLSYLPVEKKNCLIPTLDSPLTSDWVSITGPFIVVYASVQPYLSQKLQFAPDSRLDDCAMHLLYIREGVSGFKIMQFLASLEEGTHTKLPFVNFIPVRAFRILPNGPSSDVMTIDGERIENQSIQAEVIPRSAHVLIRS